EISLSDIALATGTSFAIVAVSFTLAEFFTNLIPDDANIFLSILRGIIGDNYLMLTTLTLLLVTAVPKYFESINGAQEIGTFLIYIFFVVIGVPASIPLIIQNAPIILVFAAIMVLINMIISFGVGRLFKFSLEEIILASNANIGGPTTAAAMAISRGWVKLVGPILIIGTLGYIIGNYLGTRSGLWFGSMLYIHQVSGKSEETEYICLSRLLFIKNYFSIFATKRPVTLLSSSIWIPSGISSKVISVIFGLTFPSAIS